MGFLLCLVLRKSQDTLLLWKKLLWFSERLGSSWQALGVLETSTSSLCPRVSPCPFCRCGWVWQLHLWSQVAHLPRCIGSAQCTCEMWLDASLSFQEFLYAVNNFLKFSFSPCPDGLWKVAFCLLQVSIHAEVLGRVLRSELMFLEPEVVLCLVLP